MKRIYIFTMAAAMLTASAYASEPNGYYSSCEGKSGAALLSQLCSVVANHTNVGYSGLWTMYRTTDVHPNGKIWDMYSTKEWTYSSEQCGNYKNVGDCYNREHSVPESWFSGAAPMYSDGFHIYPTDGKVNNQRGNYPFGECANGTTLAGNGNVKALGRLGASTFSGYSGTVFEPDDQYKGDFARSYFYMAAAYNDKIAGWSTANTNLGGSAYPAFNSWTVELLLKWHRQDPVSQKELDRNEAVYALQHNRNPFIDHPEMVEHIWGDKKTTGWSANGEVAPELALPVDGSVINFGTTIPGKSLSSKLVVKGSNLTGSVAVAVSGAPFSASASSFSASAACTTGGYTLTITFAPQTEGAFNGSVTVTCGALTRTVKLSGNAISTLPAGPVTSVSDDSFEAVWTYVGDDDDDEYSLNVTLEGESLDGYPKYVRAAAERYVVENLEPSTTYEYTVASVNLVSNTVSVTTLAPIPSVDVYFDGELKFVAEPGVPSDPAELLLDINNIFDDIAISVNAPFQLSTDKSEWAQQIVIDPEQDRIYLRMLSQTAGVFTGTLVISAGEYTNRSVVFEGAAGAIAGFHEDFEADASGFGNYNGGVYQGSAAKWKLSNAGIYSADRGYESRQAIRFGKDADSSIEMQENSPGGVGAVTLWAQKWTGDVNAVFCLEYSADGGNSWTNVGSATASSSEFTKFTFTVNSAQPVRLRVRQTSGERWMVDEIDAEAFTGALVPDAVADYHRWDAFCRGGNGRSVFSRCHRGVRRTCRIGRNHPVRFPRTVHRSRRRFCPPRSGEIKNGLGSPRLRMSFVV